MYFKIEEEEMNEKEVIAQYVYISDHSGIGVSLRRWQDDYRINVHACGIASTNSYELSRKDVTSLIKWLIKLERDKKKKH